MTENPAKLWLKLAPDVKLEMVGLMRWLREEVDPNHWNEWLFTLEYLFTAMATGRVELIQNLFYTVKARQEAEGLDDELAEFLEEQ